MKETPTPRSSPDTIPKTSPPTNTPMPRQPPLHPPAAILEAHGLDFGYADAKLFSYISVRIAPGVTLIQGGDGRGKTTLLRLLAGAQAADAGTLQVNQVSLNSQPDAYRQQLFWAETRSQAFDQLTPPEYFEMQRQLWPRFDSQRLSALTDGLDLAVHLHKQLFMLSTGSKRKVWLAAAFASGAAVTLLDEPFAALDAPSIRFVIQLLKEAAARQDRAYVVADYAAPADVPLAGRIDLGA